MHRWVCYRDGGGGDGRGRPAGHVVTSILTAFVTVKTGDVKHSVKSVEGVLVALDGAPTQRMVMMRALPTMLSAADGMGRRARSLS